MYTRVCPYCRQKSYSSYTERWLCPYCQRDISHIPWDIASPGKTVEAPGKVDNQEKRGKGLK